MTPPGSDRRDPRPSLVAEPPVGGATETVTSPDPMERFAGARGWALFLDIDGTLLDLAPHPERVVVPADLPGRLRRLSRALDGALALVSGRPLAGIDRLFPRELDAVGTHGAEWRLNDRTEVLALPGVVRVGDRGSDREGDNVADKGGDRDCDRGAAGGASGEVARGRGPVGWPGAPSAGDPGGADPRGSAPAWLTRGGPAAGPLARLERLPGVWLEAKPRGLAIHYRQAPEQAEATRDLARALLVALGPAYRLQAGKEVLEILPAQASKGAGIRRLMALPPYRGRTPVFAGDDLTDEDGFAAVNALGGLSIRVGTGDGTQARYRLATPAALRDWLGRLEFHLAPAAEPFSLFDYPKSRSLP